MKEMVNLDAFRECSARSLQRCRGLSMSALLALSKVLMQNFRNFLPQMSSKCKVSREGF